MVGKKTPYDIASCSTLPAIKGISSYMTQNQWLDIAIKASEGIQPEYKEQTITQRMGDLLEPVLCKEAGYMLGLDNVKVDYNEPVIHAFLPLQGSLDATGIATNKTFKAGDHDHIIIPEQDSITLNGPGVIECKCTRNMFTPNLEEWRGVLQAKGLMECTGYNWAAVIVLWQSTDFRIYLYERKSKFKKELEALVTDFNYRVKNKKYYNPANSEDANIVYNDITENTVTLDDSVDEICEAILNHKLTIKESQEEIENYELQLKQLIGNADGGITNNYSIKWPVINYKAQPEKIVPAKEAKQIRANTLRIKKNG